MLNLNNKVMKNVIKRVKEIMMEGNIGNPPDVDTYMVDGEGPWFLNSQFGTYLDERPDEIKKWPEYKVNGEKVRFDIRKIEVDGDKDLYNEVIKQGSIHYSLELDDEFLDNDTHGEGYILIVDEGILYACLYYFEKNIDIACKLLQ